MHGDENNLDDSIGHVPGYCTCGRVAGRTGKCGTCDYKERKRDRDKERDDNRRAATIARINNNRTLPNTTKPPRPRSAKGVALDKQYARDRAEWLPGRKCAVFPWLDATEIHHKKGRVGYASGAKKLRGIPLLIDKDFWLAVSRDGHNKINNESEWAFRMGYTILRSNESK